jgi:hypothetical protein
MSQLELEFLEMAAQMTFLVHQPLFARRQPLESRLPGEFVPDTTAQVPAAQKPMGNAAVHLRLSLVARFPPNGAPPSEDVAASPDQGSLAHSAGGYQGRSRPLSFADRGHLPHRRVPQERHQESGRLAMNPLHARHMTSRERLDEV